MTPTGSHVVGVLDVGDPAVDVADDGGALERRADERVHLPGRVDVAHPVVAVRVDAEAGEGVDEDAREVAGVARVAVARRVRDVGEGAAHLALDRVGAQERLGVHGVEVVDAVEQRRLEAARAERPGDHVEDDGAAQAADVDGAARGLRVVDDLRPADGRRQLISPVHVSVPLSGSSRPAVVPWPGGRGPRARVCAS